MSGTEILSYSESNKDSQVSISSGETFDYAGQAFQAPSSVNVGSVKFYVQKVNSPTGNCYAEIFAAADIGGAYAATGSALATSTAVDVSTLGTSFALKEFTFATPYGITSGNWYVVYFKYLTGDASNYVQLGFDSSTPSGSGNMAYHYTGGAHDASASDSCFYIYQPAAVAVGGTDGLAPKITETSSLSAGLDGTDTVAVKITETATVTKVFYQNTGGATVTPVGVDANVPTYARGVGGASLTPVGNTSKSTSKSVGGATSTPTGNANKGLYKAVGGATVTPAGTTTEQAVLSQSAGGATITPVGGLAKIIGKMVGGATSTPVGAIAKSISKTVGQATVTPVGNALKSISTSVGNAVITAIGAVSPVKINGETPPAEEGTIAKMQKFLKSLKNNDI